MKLWKSKGNDSNSETEKQPFVKLLKDDFFRTLWLFLYLCICLFILYFLFISLPTVFSYLYTSVGLILGLDLSALSQANLIFWQMVSLSAGAVFIGLLLAFLYKLFGFVTAKIFVKHVLRK